MASRPAEHYLHGFTPGGFVAVPARVCAYLGTRANLDDFRAAHRGQDAEVDAVLVAMRLAAMSWRSSATGTPSAATPELEPRSQWLSTAQAAAHLGMTDRGVRKAIAAGRLEATSHEGTWRITREAIAHYRTRNETG